MKKLPVFQTKFLGFVAFTAVLCLGVTTQATVIDQLSLENVVDYPLNSQGVPVQFFLTSNSTQNSQVSLFRRGGRKLNGLNLEVTCDNGIKGDSFQLDLAHERLLLTPKVNECVLKFWDRSKPQLIGGVKLIKDTKAFPFLHTLNTAHEGCNYNLADARDSIDAFFLNGSFANMTCVQDADSIETLESSEAGFAAKIETLLGTKLPGDFIKNQNPYAPLDFSKAPKLDAIFVASLVFRHDFYGTVLTRLLTYHAQRGTLVNVITTGYMQSDKDRALLYKAARESGNFRLQEYKFNDPKKGLKTPGQLIDAKYRDMHIKMFVTLSARPEDNVLIFGGRNVHDGFLFDQKPDYTKYPELTQYGKEENFVHWNDFELKVKSPGLARSMYAHLLTFRNRDTLTQQVDSINIPAKNLPLQSAQSILNSEKPLFRHIISIPFNDGHALDRLFVDMMDSAKETIEFSSPYLRPTDAIAAAMERAIRRGVKITIQTRINLEGDTMPWLYTEVNKETINKFLDRAQIYEWTKNSILHSKFLLVDGKLAFVGSVNISRRSFVQDIENGYVIRDRGFVHKMQEIFKGYTAQSKLITEQQSRKFWGSLVVRILKDQF
ncbi:MAG: phospholipase D-like domain-containing protein [Bacillota bacterium]